MREMDFLLSFLIFLIALGSLIASWLSWLVYIRTQEIPGWRRAAAGIACVLVTSQAIVCLRFSFTGWKHYSLPLYLLALPVVIAAKGLARWSLLSAWALICVICFFITLSGSAFPPFTL